MTLVLKEDFLPVAPPTAIPRRFLFLGVLAALVIGGILGTGHAFYRAQVHHGVARTMARILPLPAARVDGQWVWYREISERANALEAIAGLSQDEAVLRAIDLAERAAIARMLARELNVTVTKDEITAFSTDDAELIALRDSAGWVQRDYERYGVEPYLLAKKLEAAVLTSADHQAQARARVDRLLLKLESGIPFADLALAYSEGENAYLGGDMGYVDPGTLPPVFSNAVQDLALGDISNVIESDSSYWLLYVVDRLEETESASASVHLRGIEIKKDLLGDVVDHEFLTTKITLWLR